MRRGVEVRSGGDAGLCGDDRGNQACGIDRSLAEGLKVLLSFGHGWSDNLVTVIPRIDT